MSAEYIEDIVKEEYTIKEADIKQEQLTNYTSAGSKSKCGEVYLDHSGRNFTFICSLCLQVFPDLPSFGDHIRDVHPIPIYEISLWDPQMDSIAPVKWEPPERESVVDFAPTVPLHEIIVSDSLSAEEEKFVEIDDRWNFTDYVDYKGDSRNPNRLKRSRKLFNCYSCGKKMVNSRSRREHYKKHHPDMIESNNGTLFVPKVPNEILCTYCLKIFKDAATFDTHIDNAHVKIMFACSHCPKSFSKKDTRNNHMLIHKNIRNYKCPHCDKAFNCSSHLRSHLVRHSDERPYTCDICYKTFKTKRYAEDHNRMHFDERPFECKVCGDTFKQRMSLNSHVRVMKHEQIKKVIVRHSDERPYSCDICYKTFKTKRYVQDHKRLHSNVKTFRCKVCGDTFKKRISLNAHIRAMKHEQIKKGIAY